MLPDDDMKKIEGINKKQVSCNHSSFAFAMLTFCLCRLRFKDPSRYFGYDHYTDLEGKKH
jgi:hypothetical protein